MTDPIVTNAVEGSRLLLEAFAPVRPKPIPDPMKSVKERLIVELAAIETPKFPVCPDPEDLEAVGSHAMAVALIMDRYFRALGEELDRNAPCKVDMHCFTGVVTSAVEGFADFEARRAGDILREERAEDMA